VSSDLHAPIQKLVASFDDLETIEKLFGEASYRVYYRIQTHSGKSYIIMKLPAGIESASEEITNYRGPKGQLPFINIAQYLEKKLIPAPKILGTDLANGLILLQDLGDKTLEKLLENCNEGMRLFFYKQALDLLLDFQKTGLKEPDLSCIAFNRSFDLKLLTWEFEHFLEWGIEDRFELKIPAEEKTRMQETALKIIRPFAEAPFGLTHRDYQSRNLMLYGYQFHMIDFQDALLGPPQYDLVALLRDSYIVLPMDTVTALLGYYLAGRKRFGMPEVDEEEFVKNFHRITLQRKLKDAGRFQYILKMKNNPNFLPHVPASLGYVRQAFELLPEYGELREALARYVPELR